MSVTLLLDEHLDPKLAEILQTLGIEAISMQEWLDGHYLGHPDDEILMAAAVERLTLVSYDVHSIPQFLKRLGAAGIDHNGVIFVSKKTLRSNSVYALARAIENLMAELGDVDWRNRMVFLGGSLWPSR
jgi:Domain of unknown function (DUF5615)